MLHIRLLGVIVLSIAGFVGVAVVLSGKIAASLSPAPARVFTYSLPEGLTFGLPDHVVMPGFPQWSSVADRDWAHDGAVDALCSERLGRTCQLGTWQRFLGELELAGYRLQLEEVNRFINRVSYRSDGETWGEVDYWAAPGEFFASGGDCEDFAIAKYYSLKALGFPTEALRILVLEDTRRKLMHAVLVVDWQGESLLLDNLHDRVLTWDETQHYKPIYSINEASYRLHDGRSIADSTATAAGESLPARPARFNADQAK